MSGSLNWNCALPCLHALTKAWNLDTVCAWCLPFCLTARQYLFCAVLQRSSNHGANYLSHLFGFFALRVCIFFRTPAFSASCSRNVSMFCERLSLSGACDLAIISNAVANSSMGVWVVHFFALVLYSCRHSPSNHHLRFILLSPIRTGTVHLQI